MFDLPDGLADLSRNRREQICRICVSERKDAALNIVVTGLKALNHVHGYGLRRLCRISSAWGGNISQFYAGGGVLYRPYPESGTADAGQLLCNVDAVFFDLSERRRREITRYLDEERRDAQWNAAMIGLDTIVAEEHFGENRTEQLTKQWEFDIRDFYQDRDIQEPRLKQWLEDIGFCFENDRLQVYKSKGDDLPVRKRTAEKRIAMEDSKNAQESK